MWNVILRFAIALGFTLLIVIGEWLWKHKRDTFIVLSILLVFLMVNALVISVPTAIKYRDADKLRRITESELAEAKAEIEELSAENCALEDELRDAEDHYADKFSAALDQDLSEFDAEQWVSLAERYTGIDFYYDTDDPESELNLKIESILQTKLTDAFILGYYTREMGFEMIYPVEYTDFEKVEYYFGDYDIEKVVEYALAVGTKE